MARLGNNSIYIGPGLQDWARPTGTSYIPDSVRRSRAGVEFRITRYGSIGPEKRRLGYRRFPTRRN
jgi:hypothetical protein